MKGYNRMNKADLIALAENMDANLKAVEKGRYEMAIKLAQSEKKQDHSKIHSSKLSRLWKSTGFEVWELKAIPCARKCPTSPAQVLSWLSKNSSKRIAPGGDAIRLELIG